MIYIDEYIILNFIIDYILLGIMGKIIKNNTRKIRLLLACLISQISIISLFYSFNNYILIFLKIIICSFMILVAFGYNDIKTFIKNIVIFNMINFFLGGILFYFKSSGLFRYKYYLLLIPIVMNFYKYFLSDLIKNIPLKHRVSIYLNNGKILYLNGYMDTGNTLIEPYSNKKVIIINKSIQENFFLVPYVTIDNYSLIKCFKPRKVYIEGLGERNDIVVGVINKRFIGYNCLLNYKLMEDIC